MTEHWHQKGDGWKWVLGIIAVCLIAWLAWGKYSLNQQVAELKPAAATATKAADEVKAANASATGWEKAATEATRAKLAAEAEIERVKAEAELDKVCAIAKAKKAANARAAAAIAKAKKDAEARAGSGVPSSVTAFDGSAPKLDGSDVLVPDVLVRAIPGFNPNQAVLAAWDGDGWFVRGPAYATPGATKAATMVQEGNFWRAKGMAGRRFHPVQLDSEKKPVWALIEEIWPELNESFIDRSNKKGPCLLVRG